jgi:filamentous hemagglutinin
VAVQQIATDAFGNALGSSIAGAMTTNDTYAQAARAMGRTPAQQQDYEDGLRDGAGDSIRNMPNMAEVSSATRPPGESSVDEWKRQQVDALIRAGRYGEAIELQTNDLRMTSEGLRSFNNDSLGVAGGDQLAFKPPELPEAVKQLLSGDAEEKAAEQVAKAAAQGGSRLAPFLRSALPVLGELTRGVGLFFHMEDAPTTDWTAAGATFSHNPDDGTLRIADAETGKGLTVPGIQKPSQYSDAQYLSYVTYKANGGELSINDFVGAGAPDGVGPLRGGKAGGFDVTDAVTVSGRRPIDLGKSYEAAVRSLYGNEVSYAERQYQAIVDGKLVDGVADHVIDVNGKRIAIEAKFVDDWNTSPRNPDGAKGSYPWSIKMQQDMVDQAFKYSAFFESGVIYHTNSQELATLYQNLFNKLGVQNFKFVITPATRK